MHQTSAKMQQPVPEASGSELSEQLKEEERAVEEIHSTESVPEASGSGLTELLKEEECADKEISVPEASESGLIELLKEKDYIDEEFHLTESVPEASGSGLTHLLKEEEFTDEEIFLTESESEGSGSGLTGLLKDEEFTDEEIHLMESDSEASGSGLTKLLKEVEGVLKGIHLTDDKNKMPELPKCPDCSSFITFYLEGNYEPTAIPPLFFQRMELLQVLDLSRTSIKSLPKSLPKLVALKKFLLQACDLFMELSPQVGELKNLEELDLDETQIMDLPIETGKLLKLSKLRVSFYHLFGKKKLKSNILIHPETISNLSQLAELSIDVNPADKRWDDSVEAVLKELCNSKSLRTLILYLPEVQLLDNISLIYPSLSRFRFTVGRNNRRIISRVPHDVEAEFRNWDKCLKFVNGKNIPVEIKEVLKYSTSFFLDRHATAVNLSEFGFENMKGLKFCLLAECNEMETLIDGHMQCERNEDDQSESAELVLQSLEYLGIYYMENLQSIWRGPNHFGCMSKLKFLALHACPQLSQIFCHTLLENFVNLEEIILEDCPQVTSLVGHASVKPIISDKMFLPRLKRLLLLYLPELVSISNGLLIAPKLESIGCYNCPKLKSISKMELSSKYLKIIKGECQWWEDLNWNETEWGNRPDCLMRIFSPIDNEKDVMTQLTEDRDLLEATIQNGDQQQDRKNQPDYLMRIPDPINNEKDMMTHLAEDSDILEMTVENEGQQQDEEKDVMPQLAEDGDQLEATIESKGQQSESINQPDYLMRIFSPTNKGKDVIPRLVEDKDLLETTIENEGQQPEDEMLIAIQDHKAQRSGYTQVGTAETDVITTFRRIYGKAPETKSDRRNIYSNMIVQKLDLHDGKSKRLIMASGLSDWWDKFNHPDFPDEEFKKAFRMSKATFNMVCEELETEVRKKKTMLRDAIPVSQRVAVCIWRLATAEPLRMVSKRFRLGISTCHKLVLEVCTAIKTVLMPKFAQWPDEIRMKRIKDEFESATGIPNVGGIIYTTHVPIIAPKANVAAYFNKKQTERTQKNSYSITLQGIVDQNGVFSDVCIGWPGSMSDEQILEKSAFYERATRGKLKVVGSKGYPLMDWVLVPYTHQNLTWAQHAFNEKISEIGKVGKEAFARLKGRWSFLQKRTEVKLQELPVVVAACCVLHNICEIRNEEMDAELIFELVDDEVIPENNLRSTASVQARDQIAHRGGKSQPELENPTQIIQTQKGVNRENPNLKTFEPIKTRTRKGPNLKEPEPKKVRIQVQPEIEPESSHMIRGVSDTSRLVS